MGCASLARSFCCHSAGATMLIPTVAHAKDITFTILSDVTLNGEVFRRLCFLGVVEQFRTTEPTVYFCNDIRIRVFHESGLFYTIPFGALGRSLIIEAQDTYHTGLVEATRAIGLDIC